MAVSNRGAISFGMVHIPVALYTATQDSDIHFNQICKEDGSRVKYKKICAGCRIEVSFYIIADLPAVALLELQHTSLCFPQGGFSMAAYSR